jgi:predicted nucleic acid-binding protein
MFIYGTKIGKKMNKLVIGDADAIIAQVNPRDLLHKKAKQTTQKLLRKEVTLVYPVTAVMEAVTYIQRVLNNKEAAYQIAEEFRKNSHQLVSVNPEFYMLAVNKYFKKKGSKKDTIFDCIVAAVAEKIEADAIFSFDKFYKKNGFSLASEF